MRWFIRIVLALVVLAVAAVAGVFAVQQDRDVNTVIEIDAPPERVWAVLSNTARYSEWFPTITDVEGPLEPGGTIAISRSRMAGMVSTVHAKVLAVVPNEEIRWISDVPLPQMFVGKHKFILQPIGDGRTRLRHEEEFTGLLVGLLTSTILDRTEREFNMTNRALKARVEGGG